MPSCVQHEKDFITLEPSQTPSSMCFRILAADSAVCGQVRRGPTCVLLLLWCLFCFNTHLQLFIFLYGASLVRLRTLCGPNIYL